MTQHAKAHEHKHDRLNVLGEELLLGVKRSHSAHQAEQLSNAALKLNVLVFHDWGILIRIKYSVSEKREDVEQVLDGKFPNKLQGMFKVSAADYQGKVPEDNGQYFCYVPTFFDVRHRLKTFGTCNSHGVVYESETFDHD